MSDGNTDGVTPRDVVLNSSDHCPKVIPFK